MRFCKNCSFFYATENEVEAKFIDVLQIKDDEGVEPPCNTVLKEGYGKINMCQHPDCFKEDIIVDIVQGPVKTKKRIAGQAQFNKDFNCKRYKREFWVKDIDANFLPTMEEQDIPLMPKVKPPKDEAVYTEREGYAGEELSSLQRLSAMRKELVELAIKLCERVPLSIDPNLIGHQFYVMVSTEVYHEIQKRHENAEAECG